MKDQKTFSIIMPTYNCAGKVEKTLRSIFSQDKDLFELIVVDGASSDGTVERIRGCGENFKLVSERDNGIYSAFNKGIDLASGRYLYFIGAGDCLQPQILAQVKDLLPSGNASLVYGKCFFVEKKCLDGRPFTASDFSWTNICHQGEFYHHSIFDIIGKYDERFKVFADWMLNVKCFIDENIDEIFIPLHIADFEGNGVSSDLDNDPQFKKEFPKFIRRNLGFRAFVKCKFKMTKPNSVYFYEGFGYAFLRETLEPVLPPFRPIYRYMKKLIGRS